MSERREVSEQEINPAFPWEPFSPAQYDDYLQMNDSSLGGLHWGESLTPKVYHLSFQHVCFMTPSMWSFSLEWNDSW